MKGDTSSEPGSHFQPRTQHTVVVFCLVHFVATFKVSRVEITLGLELLAGLKQLVSALPVFWSKETQAFLLGTSAPPLSPKQQRNLQQACAKGELRLEETGNAILVCFRLLGQSYSPNIPSLKTLFCPVPSPSLRALSRCFDMLNLLILFFFLLQRGSNLSRVSAPAPSPSRLSKGYLCLLCFFCSKQKTEVGLPLHFSSGAFLSSGGSLEMRKKNAKTLLDFTLFCFSS